MSNRMLFAMLLRTILPPAVCVLAGLLRVQPAYADERDKGTKPMDANAIIEDSVRWGSIPPKWRPEFATASTNSRQTTDYPQNNLAASFSARREFLLQSSAEGGTSMPPSYEPPQTAGMYNRGPNDWEYRERLAIERQNYVNAFADTLPKGVGRFEFRIYDHDARVNYLIPGQCRIRGPGVCFRMSY